MAGVIAGIVFVATNESVEDGRLEALKKRLVACGVSQDFVMDEIYPMGETSDGGTVFALPFPDSVSPEDVLELTVDETDDEGYVMYGPGSSPLAGVCGGTDKWFYEQRQPLDEQ